MTVVAFTGIREIADEMADEIELAVLDEIGSGATVLRFGGARGSDTLALEAARDQEVRRIVYLPFHLAHQPGDAREAIESCADEVIELRGPTGSRSAYFARNRALIAGADRVVAFTDGRRGGTDFTIREARRAGLPVAIVPVRGTGGPRSTEPREIDFSGEVFALAEYLGERRGAHALSELVRRNKVNEARPTEIRALARRLAEFVRQTEALAAADAIAAMPRRQPHARSDLAALARAIGRELRIDVVELVRSEEPLRGSVRDRGIRLSAEEHARTLRYGGRRGATVIVLDGVVTTGGPMEGAMQAIRSGGGVPLGLAVLFSASFSPEPF